MLGLNASTILTSDKWLWIKKLELSVLAGFHDINKNIEMSLKTNHITVDEAATLLHAIADFQAKWKNAISKPTLEAIYTAFTTN